jgi:hypothetical protein
MNGSENIGIGKVWNIFQTMPSTNVRIATTIIMALGTGIRVVIIGWNPPSEWLLFLTGWAGLDVLQFGAKRATSNDFVAAKQGVVPPPPPTPPEIGT